MRVAWKGGKTAGPAFRHYPQIACRSGSCARGAAQPKAGSIPANAGLKGTDMAGNGSSHAGSGGLAVARVGSPELIGADGFELSSAAFEDGDDLDPSFTAAEEDAVAPPLEWTAPPDGAVELALVVEDAG